MRRPLCLLCLLLMLFLWMADWLGLLALRENPLPEEVRMVIREHPDTGVAGTAENIRDYGTYQTILLSNSYLLYHSEKIPLQKIQVQTEDKTEILPGAVCLVSGHLQEPDGARNPGEFDFRAYNFHRHIYYVMKDAQIEKVSESFSVAGKTLRDLREKLKRSLDHAAEKDAGVFQTILLGDKSSLSDEVYLEFQMGGILHILAISGLHISLLGAALYELFRKGCLGLPLSGFLSASIMLGYTVLAGFGTSAVRALIMFFIYILAKVLGRIYDLLSALALSAILLLLDSPGLLYDGGFLLSFGAVLGTGAVYPVLYGILRGSSENEDKQQRNPESRMARLGCRIRKALCASLSVQITILPVQLWFYGEVSLAGIFLNLLVVPTMGVFLLSAAAAAFAGLWFPRSPVCVAAAMPGRVLLAAYRFLCRSGGSWYYSSWIPGKPQSWQVLLYYAIAAAALYCGNLIQGSLQRGDQWHAPGNLWHVIRNLWHVSGKKLWKTGILRARAGASEFVVSKKSRRNAVFYSTAVKLILAATCSVGILVLSLHPRGHLRITALDVGQGDGIVLELPGRHAFLIDGGSSGKESVGRWQLIPFLKNQGLPRLDGILVSHTDMDHISGILELLEMMAGNLTPIHVNYLFLPAWEDPPEEWERLRSLAESCGIQVRTLGEGDVFTCEKATFRILSPQKGKKVSDMNEDGTVLELSYGDFEALFPGDIGEETEQRLLGSLRDVDFLKVAHHGSRFSSCEAFLEKTRPEIAVISCSLNNVYGHPSEEAVERLQAAGCQVEYTMKNGAVTVETDGKRVRVSRFVGNVS